MRKLNIYKKEGILFWITGLAGSGKSSIARYLTPKIQKYYGPTIMVSGDNLRNIHGFRKYTKKDRLKFAKTKLKFCELILRQKINLVYSTISMFDKVREMNKKKFSNYIEIYIKTDLKKIVKNKKKKIYSRNKMKNIWGVDLKPQFPKKPNIVVVNDFKKPISFYANQILNELKKIIIQ